MDLGGVAGSGWRLRLMGWSRKEGNDAEEAGSGSSVKWTSYDYVVDSASTCPPDSKDQTKS